jgi:8-oxo-dGTP pyrophosphatase MutT (NUDIX family)
MDAEQKRQSQPENLLVSSQFSTGLSAEMKRASSTEYPHYPHSSDRLRMSLSEIYTWREQGGRTQDLPAGNYTVMNHPNYLRGLAKGTALVDDGTTDFSKHIFTPTFDTQEYRRDERGIPIRPYDEVFLATGAIAGFGFYRTYGPNRAADPVVFRERGGKLQVLMIERSDTGLVALPGGMQDPDEPEVSVATRELFEEAGVDLRSVSAEVVHQGIVWSDTRSTRNAWSETTVVLLLPDPDKTDAMKLHAGDDARSVTWMDVNEQNLARDALFMTHGRFIRQAVLVWQEKTNSLVDKVGRIYPI